MIVFKNKVYSRYIKETKHVLVNSPTGPRVCPEGKPEEKLSLLLFGFIDSLYKL